MNTICESCGMLAFLYSFVRASQDSDFVSDTQHCSMLSLYSSDIFVTVMI